MPNDIASPNATKKDKDAGLLSATSLQYLNEWLIKQKFGRRKELEIKYLKKGISEEQASIELLSEYMDGEVFDMWAGVGTPAE